MLAQPARQYSLEEYLEIDRQSDARLEYWDGDIFEMSGANEAHAMVEVNLMMQLGQRLDQAAGRLFGAQFRLKVPSFPPYRYADLSALCGAAELEQIGDIDVLTNPSLIIEVSSDLTEGYDRGQRFSHYKSIPSFCEYLLIVEARPYVTQYLKQGENAWLQHEYHNLNDDVLLSSVGVELSLREIYGNVTFKALKPKWPPLD
jgi:Uma2 family endonuclease